MTRFWSEAQIAPFQVGFPPGKRWLFFAPHPDDETVGAGASLALAAAQGVAVRLVVVTDGQAQGEAMVRRREAQEATHLLGLRELVFWGLEDRTVARSKTLPELMSREFKVFSPELVFLPSPVELHPDHRALAWHGQRALRRWVWLGLRPKPLGWVAFYEVGSALWPNLLVAGDQVWDLKREALASYRSQLAVRPYDRVMEGLATFRTLTLSGVDKAEAFAVFPVHRVVRCSFQGLQRLVALPSQ